MDPVGDLLEAVGAVVDVLQVLVDGGPRVLRGACRCDVARRGVGDALEEEVMLCGATRGEKRERVRVSAAVDTVAFDIETQVRSTERYLKEGKREKSARMEGELWIAWACLCGRDAEETHFQTPGPARKVDGVELHPCGCVQPIQSWRTPSREEGA